MEFYAGKSVSLVVGAGSGGGYDAWGRFLAQHLARHIPGEPTIIVQNFTGAGGLRAALHIPNVAPKDGTVIGLIQPTALVAPLLGTKEALFDLRRFSWIFNPPGREYSLCSSWFSSVRAAQDLFTKGHRRRHRCRHLDNGGLSERDHAVLGTHIKIISGCYQRRHERLCAMERGEVGDSHGAALSTYKVVRPLWLRDKKLNFLLQTSLDKDPELPDVPWIMDFAKSDDQRHILELILAPRLIVRPVFSPRRKFRRRRIVCRRCARRSTPPWWIPELLKDAAAQKLDIIPMTGASRQRRPSRPGSTRRRSRCVPPPPTR